MLVALSAEEQELLKLVLDSINFWESKERLGVYHATAKHAAAGGKILPATADLIRRRLGG
jgi:hypothetical protein